MSKRFRIMLQDHRTNEPIQEAGGACYVAAAAGTAKVALIDKDGATITNPVAIVNGVIEFHVADSINSVDLYVMGPGGHFVELSTVKPSGPNEIRLDQGIRHQVARIPFNIADTTATTETDTGFDLPAKCCVHPNGMGLDVVTLDATEVIDVGLLASEGGGDADGFMDAVTVNTAGLKLAETGFNVGSNAVYMDLTGGDTEFTYGVMMVPIGAKVALAEGSDVNTDEGYTQLVDHLSDEVTAKSISYTLSAGSDTAAGFIQFEYTLMG